LQSRAKSDNDELVEQLTILRAEADKIRTAPHLRDLDALSDLDACCAEGSARQTCSSCEAQLRQQTFFVASCNAIVRAALSIEHDPHRHSFRSRLR